jgi:hypothetical protein
MGDWSGFMDVIGKISDVAGKVAPSITQMAASLKKSASGGLVTAPPTQDNTKPIAGVINTPFGPMSPMMIGIPIAGIVGFLLIRKMRKHDRKRKR